ncbi:hypothetical protein CVT26_001261 [Gymnopilus dilepis]|uniref:F-box domain-containing protein n=1 Tax=Gymnopilus dilepis TaxID=231916 RepID=A0A409Y273_9AGAR|nr:hypothetical protein CVT26_001261 [Gymnopilus dilepis]
MGESSTSNWGTPIQYLLATVCRRWRNLVINTPLLWALILISSDTSFDCFKNFERSQPALVDVSFDSFTSSADSNLFAQTSDAIAQHIARVRSLKIRVWASQEIYTIFESWKNLEAPNLESLEISVSSWAFNSPLTFPSPTFSSASSKKSPFWRGGKSLRSLKLDGFSYQEFGPLPSLTSLDLDKLNASPQEFQDILTICPLLAKLVVRQYGGPSHAPQNLDHIREIDASSLRRLAVKIGDDHYYEECPCALPFLSMANLEYLEIINSGAVSDSHFIAISKQWKSLPRLKRLIIRGSSIWETDTSFLSCLPRTTTLEVISFPRVAHDALATILTLSNLNSLIFDLSGTSARCLNAQTFSEVVAKQQIELRCPTIVKLPRSIEIDPTWIDLQATLGDRFSVVKPSEKGSLDDMADYPLLSDGEEDLRDSRHWMLDQDDSVGSDEFREYDDFELYDRDEIEYLHEDDFDEDEEDPFEYNHWED